MAKFRRTNHQIEIDQKRLTAGLPEVPWARLIASQHAEFTINPLLMPIPEFTVAEEIDDEPNFTKPDPKIVAANLAATVGAVEYSAVDAEPAPVQAAVGADLTALVAKAVAVAMASATNTVFDALDKRTAEIIQKTQGQKVLAAIKINDGPAVKIDGAHPQLPDIVATVQGFRGFGVHVALVGPAGSGKTILAEQTATALSLGFGHVCCTAGMSETWLFGRQTPNGYQTAPFVETYEKGGLFLFDEYDAIDANMALAINTAMANGHIANPITGRTIKKHENAVFMFGMNTFGMGADAVYGGRNKLDEASRDRFIPIVVSYLAEIENKIASGDQQILQLIRSLRYHAQKAGSPHVVSYRGIVKAVVLKRLGKTMKEIQSTLTLGWDPDLVSTFHS